MLKRYMFLVLIVSFCSLRAVDVSEPTHQLVKAYKLAWKALAPYLNSITASSWQECHGKKTETYYDYQSDSQVALEKLGEYQSIDSLLSDKVVLNAMGDGLMIGMVAALCNSLCGAKTVNTKSLSSVAIAMIMTALIKYHQAEKMEGVDASLRRRSVFSNGHPFGNGVIGFIGGAIGYAIGSCIFLRISDLLASRHQ